MSTPPMMSSLLDQPERSERLSLESTLSTVSADSSVDSGQSTPVSQSGSISKGRTFMRSGARKNSSGSRGLPAGSRMRNRTDKKAESSSQPLLESAASSVAESQAQGSSGSSLRASPTPPQPTRPPARQLSSSHSGVRDRPSPKPNMERKYLDPTTQGGDSTGSTVVKQKASPGSSGPPSAPTTGELSSNATSDNSTISSTSGNIHFKSIHASEQVGQKSVSKGSTPVSKAVSPTSIGSSSSGTAVATSRVGRLEETKFEPLSVGRGIPKLQMSGGELLVVAAASGEGEEMQSPHKKNSGYGDFISISIVSEKDQRMHEAEKFVPLTPLDTQTYDYEDRFLNKLVARRDKERNAALIAADLASQQQRRSHGINAPPRPSEVEAAQAAGNHLAGISEEIGGDDKVPATVEEDEDDEDDDVSTGALAPMAGGDSEVRKGFTVVGAWYGDIGRTNSMRATIHDVTSQMAAKVQGSGAQATFAFNPLLEAPDTFEKTPYQAGVKFRRRKFMREVVAQLKGDAKAFEESSGHWAKETLDEALGFRAAYAAANKAAVDAAAESLAENTSDGGTMSYSLSLAKAGFTPGVAMDDPTARALAGDLNQTYRSLCLHVAAPGLPPGMLVELRTPAQPGGGRLSVFMQFSKRGRLSANWPLRIVPALFPNAGRDSQQQARALRPSTMPDLTVQLFLEARARRRQARAKAARLKVHHRPKRVVRAMSSLHEWAVVFMNKEAEREEARLAALKQLKAKMRVRSSRMMFVLKAKRNWDYFLGTVLFAGWIFFFLLLLLWMLRTLPGLNGYPIETWVPTKCQYEDYAEANKALCGLE